MLRNVVRCFGCGRARLIVMFWQTHYTSGIALVHPFCAACAGPRFKDVSIGMSLREGTEFFCDQLFEGAFRAQEETHP